MGLDAADPAGRIPDLSAKGQNPGTVLVSGKAWKRPPLLSLHAGSAGIPAAVRSHIGRARLQAGITLTMSSLRAITLAAGAYLTGSLEVLIWTLVALMILKLGMLMAYVVRYHGLHGRRWHHIDRLAIIL